MTITVRSVAAIVWCLLLGALEPGLARADEAHWTVEQKDQMRRQIRPLVLSSLASARDENIDTGPVDEDAIVNCIVTRFIAAVPGPATVQRLGVEQVRERQGQATDDCAKEHLAKAKLKSAPKRWTPELLSMFHDDCLQRGNQEAFCTCYVTELPKRFPRRRNSPDWWPL